MLHLYDSATGDTRELTLREPGKVSMYVCGPTVYAPPHLGHGRMTLTYDILRRYLAWTGLDVQFVSNVTDIEDNIINRAEAEGKPWQEIVERCEKMWWKAMDALNVARPTHTPHATEYVDEMVDMIGQLMALDSGYVTPDGIYLSVESVPGYGLLAHQSLDEMLAGGGDRVVVGADDKRHPSDFVLWKFTKPGEPSWPSPWGDGRPGWHSECVVMALQILGEGFDLHTGGQDLRFPHHENERAQAVALGRPFANHWMHNGFVVDTSGEKMSKSLGNVANLLDLVDQYDPRAYRMVLLQTHYRSPVTVVLDNIESSERSLARLDALARRAGASQLPVVSPDAQVLAEFRLYMDNDLDTPAATALMFETVTRANSMLDERAFAQAAGQVAALHEICTAFGLVLRDYDVVPADIAAQAAGLDAARAAKDWATADAVRAELMTAGWVVENTKDGTKLHRA